MQRVQNRIQWQPLENQLVLGSERGRRIPKVRQEQIKKLQSLQKRMIMWSSRSTDEQLRDRLRRFIPDSEIFWTRLANSAKKSREDYETQLLDATKIRHRISAINRGARLVLSASLWERPIVGDGSVAESRGKQWQTTIAWMGLELVNDSLFPRYQNSDADTVIELCKFANCNLLDEPIPVPASFKKSASAKNLWQQDVGILEFLNVRGGKTRKALDQWWIQQQPITEYPAALQAARAIRDATAHGLLSAHRVEKFGLLRTSKNAGSSILDQLIDVMINIAKGTLEVLLKA